MAQRTCSQVPESVRLVSRESGDLSRDTSGRCRARRFRLCTGRRGRASRSRMSTRRSLSRRVSSSSRRRSSRSGRWRRGSDERHGRSRDRLDSGDQWARAGAGSAAASYRSGRRAQLLARTRTQGLAADYMSVK